MNYYPPVEDLENNSLDRPLDRPIFRPTRRPTVYQDHRPVEQIFNDPQEAPFYDQPPNISGKNNQDLIIKKVMHFLPVCLYRYTQNKFNTYQISFDLTELFPGKKGKRSALVFQLSTSQ